MPAESDDKLHFRKQKTYFMFIYPGCNFRCKFCLAEDVMKDAAPLSWEGLIGDLDRLKNEGYVNIDITGGEPTLYARLPDLIAEILKRGMNPMIGTNGAMLCAIDRVKAYARHHPLGIELSFHSHRPEVFDEVTQIKGSFKKVVKTIDVLQDHFSFYPQGTDPREFLAANIIIAKHNYKDIEKIMLFLHGRGIRIFRFSQLLLKGAALREHGMLISARKMVPYLQKALKTAKKLGISYAIDRLPLCILPGEEENFISWTIPGIKMNFCQDCKLSPRCGGITKAQLIAEYGTQLLSWQFLFPKNFFTEQDIAFLDEQLLRSANKA
jgi:molybdenum cofactor biosynthesis enzyme MoaA